MLSIEEISAALVERNVPVKSIQKMGGYANVNVLLELQDGARLVLKVLQQKGLRTVEEETLILNTLHRLGVYQVPKPFHHHGFPKHLFVQRNWELRWYQYQEGRNACPWYVCPDDEIIYEAFQDLAKLHLGLRQIRSEEKVTDSDIPLNEAILANWERLLCAWPALANMEVMLRWIEQVASIRLELAELGDTEEKSFYIHGDIQTENYLVHSSGNTWLDFEHLRLGAQGLELGLGAVKFCKFGRLDAPLQVSESGFRLAIRSYSALVAIDERRYVKFNFWKAYFAWRECMLYFEKALAGTWHLIPEIGFYPCLLEVLTYKKEPCAV